ncbi:hypothetical protein KEJ39_02140 [Candidatus Bathyarchaeota archaeon]|nr:hypothetical protein [Candidatus Bathyarchaeota archaeon]
MNRRLLKLFTRPQRHTLPCVFSATILTFIMMTTLLGLSDQAATKVLPTMISAAMSSIALNEVSLVLERRKRDVAVLLAVGIQKHLVGFMLAARAVLYSSLSCLLGAVSCYILLHLTMLGSAPTINLLLTLSILAVIAPSLVAGAYGALYSFRIDVTGVLRH